MLGARRSGVHPEAELAEPSAGPAIHGSIVSAASGAPAAWLRVIELWSHGAAAVRPMPIQPQHARLHAPAPATHVRLPVPRLRGRDGAGMPAGSWWLDTPRRPVAPDVHV